MSTRALTISLVATVACAGACRTPAVKSPASPPAAQAKKTAPARAPADPDAARLVKLAKSGPTLAKFPQADAVVVLDRDDITLRPDGGTVQHHLSIVRILDAQRGKRKYADVHIPYDTSRQTLKIERARTANADGSVADVSPSELSEIVPPSLEDATTYSHVRERVVSFPAVDKGSVVELEYTRTTRPTPDATLGGQLLLGAWDPVERRVVTLTVPPGTKPRFQVVGVDLQPARSRGANTRTYSFVERNLPDRNREIGSPQKAAVLPRLVYSFLPSWKAVLARVSDRYLDAGVPKAVPAVVKARADALVAGARTDMQRAIALYRFVSHDVRTVALPLGWAGYAPHAPDVVLANRYGDDRDKVGLLLSLCAAEHIHGEPVLVRSGAVPVLKSVPTLAQFDRLIARLRIDGNDVWVDPADEHGQLGVAPAGEGTFALALARGGGQLAARPALDPAASTARIEERLILGRKGSLDARYRYKVDGWAADQLSRMLEPLKGKHLDRFFQSAAAGLSASAVDAGHHVGDLMAARGSIQVTQRVTVPSYAPAQGRFRVFEVPDPTLGFLDSRPPVGPETRKYPLLAGTPHTLIRNVILTVPRGWKVAALPPPVSAHRPGVRYDAACKARGKKVTCHSELAYNEMLIQPADYAGFRQTLSRVDNYRQRVVLLTR